MKASRSGISGMTGGMFQALTQRAHRGRVGALHTWVVWVLPFISQFQSAPRHVVVPRMALISETVWMEATICSKVSSKLPSLPAKSEGSSGAVEGSQVLWKEDLAMVPTPKRSQSRL